MADQKPVAWLAITFGALVPPIVKQLRDQGLKPDRAEVAIQQHNADAVTRLLVHGVLAESEGRNARKRILKEIVELVRRPDAR